MAVTALPFDAEMAWIDPDGRHRVLVIAGELCCCDALVSSLACEGFDVEIATTAAEGLRRFANSPPEVVLLGPSLPDSPGIDICERLRKSGRVPIVFVDEHSSESRVVLGLEAGAEDYITSPCRTQEVVARIRAVLRRRTINRPMFGRTSIDDVVTIGPIELHPQSRCLFVNGVAVPTTPKEFDLLVALASPPGVLRTREELIDQLWSPGRLTDSRSVDKHVRGLRSKIELDPAKPTHLVTVRGIGFRLQV